MSEPARPRILVVDDIRANLVAMRRLLSKVDAEVIEVDNGEAALTACLDGEFALILLDIQMPGMDGFEVAQLLSGQGDLSETPIIFVTANYTEEFDRLKGYSLGAVDYLTKPVNETILLSKVRVFLELHRARGDLKRLVAELGNNNARLKVEVEERKRAEEEARHLATHDPLTDLPNRALFIERLRQAMQRTQRTEQQCGLLYIDIDGFKPINDQLGHQAGDDLLKAIGQRLRGVARRTDTVSRLGGDEFALVLEDVEPGSDGAARAATTVVESLSQPYTLLIDGGERTVVVGASVGVALYPGDAAGEDGLIGCADAAMYAAKRGGKNQYRLAATLA
jgi:diguanylate cyclase (GGDEF)-like protein